MGEYVCRVQDELSTPGVGFFYAAHKGAGNAVVIIPCFGFGLSSPTPVLRRTTVGKVWYVSTSRIGFEPPLSPCGWETRLCSTEPRRSRRTAALYRKSFGRGAVRLVVSWTGHNTCPPCEFALSTRRSFAEHG